MVILFILNVGCTFTMYIKFFLNCLLHLQTSTYYENIKTYLNLKKSSCLKDPIFNPFQCNLSIFLCFLFCSLSNTYLKYTVCSINKLFNAYDVFYLKKSFSKIFCHYIIFEYNIHESKAL